MTTLQSSAQIKDEKQKNLWKKYGWRWSCQKEGENEFDTIFSNHQIMMVFYHNFMVYIRFETNKI